MKAGGGEEFRADSPLKAEPQTGSQSHDPKIMTERKSRVSWSGAPTVISLLKDN